MKKKKGKTANYKIPQNCPYGKPIWNKGRHVDPAHLGKTSHEKPVLSERMQNWDLLAAIASETSQGDWKSQISVAISRGFERSFSSSSWGKNKISWAREDQEEGKQLAYNRQAPLLRHLRIAPLALMLFHFEGCHHDTIAHYYPYNCDDVRHPTSTQTSNDLACACCP